MNNPVHIRIVVRCKSFQPDHNGECLNCDDPIDDHDHATTFCGRRGESISLAHWHYHVVPNRDGCCKELYRRLCDDCDKVIPFSMKDDSMKDDSRKDAPRDA